MVNPDAGGYTPKQENKKGSENDFAKVKQESEKKEEFVIPPDVKRGTAERANYGLDKQIFTAKENLKKESNNTNKERLEDLNLQKKMLEVIIKQNNDSVETPAEFNKNSETIIKNPLRESMGKFSAQEARELIQKHFIDTLEKSKERGNNLSYLDGDSTNTMFNLEKLLTVAHHLQTRLDFETMSGNEEKATQEKIKKENSLLNQKNKEDINAVREKIKDINNPDRTAEKQKEFKEAAAVNEKSPEREKAREKIIKYVLKDGGIKFVMCFEQLVAKGQTEAGQQAYFEKMKNKEYRSSTQGTAVSYMTSPEEYSKNCSSVGKIMRDKKINEIVDIHHVEEAQYKTVVKTPGKKGNFLGWGKEDPVMKEEYIGSKKMMHNEVVEDGKNEPAVRISYYVEKEGWKSIAMGRGGQNMSMEIVVPESIADAVKQELKDDPAFIRTLSDEVVKKKILNDPEDWEKLREYDYKIRPPYEQWDKEEGGGRIYIQDNEDISKRGWREESIKKVKK